MRRGYLVCLTLMLLISLTACGNNRKVSNSSNEQLDVVFTDDPTLDSIVDSEAPVEKTEGIDVDLTTLSSTMVYSEVYNMMVSPDEYIGKTIRMDGTFSMYEDVKTGKTYFACIVSDATACCSQGIEFSTEEDLEYPKDYPELDSYITVTGVFDKYEEDGTTYCILKNAKFE